MQAVRRLIEKVATSPTRTVLIYGETGTGKGLVARNLHRLSGRPGAFVDINCAAIPSSLMEAELFGHERGAFTGAVAKRTGLVEAADGGTLFLDEIRELDLTLQAKLLSLLDSRSFRRVGATRSTTVDIRFVAATNRILLAEVEANRFRQDLYYRLQVIAINIPPLRERGDDLFYLADHFLRRLNKLYQRNVRGFHPETARLLSAYSWPGNVRELENFLERIVLVETEDEILPSHLPARILRAVTGHPAQSASAAAPVAAATMPADFHEATHAYQRALLVRALEDAGGNVTRAAAALSLSRHAFRYQMARLKLV